nr:hypothetical protein CoNPh38_CDS0299 [Staphylococcus phage S-CoN_Ph38]
MTNLTIENYIKNNMDSTEVEHLADYGLDHVAPNGLVSYHERTEFFDKYYNDIQAEMIDLAGGSGELLFMVTLSTLMHLLKH